MTIPADVLTRLQMNMIDRSKKPDGEFKWILHLRDDYSKFNWTFPMASKESADIAKHLLDTFCMFGAPKILQSYDGKYTFTIFI